MSSTKICQGDQVIVISGRSAGQRGTVASVRGDGRLIVDGVNMVKKNVRPDPNQGIQGGIEEREAPIHHSNVKIYNPTTQKGDRLGFKVIDESGAPKKVRIFKSSGEVVDS